MKNGQRPFGLSRTGSLWIVLFFIFSLALPATLHGAPKAALWPKWQANNPRNDTQVDHGTWDSFLQAYVVADHPSGINRVRYGTVTPKDKKALGAYIDMLQGIQVSTLNRAEQKAFWINLYNAFTVQTILDHYPVASIRDIDISPGWFSDGPWGAKLVTIEGEKVALDDMEHRILRPLWKDNRIHYAVNCASLGCPNIQKTAYTRDNLEMLMEKGTRSYINHPRGVRVEGETLTISSIYKWFQEDFGHSEKGVMDHLIQFAAEPLKKQLENFDGKIKYEYDWHLNEF